MLGPLFALTLLVTPASGPSQLCFSFDSDAQRLCERQRDQNREIQRLSEQVERLQQQERNRPAESPLLPSTGSGSGLGSSLDCYIQHRC